MRPRTLLLLLTLAGLAGALMLPQGRLTAPAPQGRAALLDPPGKLQIFYTPPVLVEMGEPVRIPVDAVCVTAEGNACSSRVTFGTRVGDEPWNVSTRDAAPGLAFDATRAARKAGEGSVWFFIRAQTETGLTSSVGSEETPLRFWVTARLPSVRLPEIPFGAFRKPTTALFLPWGSGPMRAGIAPGKESLTAGPSAFDVDDRGRLYILDSEQDRLAVFSNGNLSREVRLPLNSLDDVAVGEDGSAYVLNRLDGSVAIRLLTPAAGLGPRIPVGEALAAHLHAAGDAAYVNLLPLDGWVKVPATAPEIRSDVLGAPSVGRPLGPDTELLRVGNGSDVRLATVDAGVVSNGVRVHSDRPLGDVALAEPDGRGGYWCVVRVWRDGPVPADQYEVAHVRGTEVLEAFAVANRAFAETPPLSRFRLGPDGVLYQLATSPRGMRILRYELGRGT